MRRVTINDVAREAGVSRQTVSRAINDKSEISAATRTRVLEAVERLGYRPNRLAQGMVTQRTRTVGLEIGDITNPFFAEVVRGAQEAAAPMDYSLFLGNSADSHLAALRLLETLVAQGVDGLIAVLGRVSDQEIRDFADRFRPLVLINRHLEHPNVSAVCVDIGRGPRLAVDYLVAAGHRRIGMISNVPGPASDARRLTGFRAAMAGHDLALPPARLVNRRSTLEGGYEATRHLLEASPDTSAIFAYNDLMAIGALRACADLGRRVPEACAVVGFDDIPLARMVTPPLTTISYDKREMGRRAFRRVLEMIEVPDRHFPPIELPLHLAVRASTDGVQVPTS